MAVVERIDKPFDVGGGSVLFKVFEWAECDATFEPAKQPDWASCPVCLANDVAQVVAADR